MSDLGMLAAAPSFVAPEPRAKRAKLDVLTAAEAALVAADGPVDLSANGGTRAALDAHTVGVITDPKCVARATAAGTVIKGVVSLTAPSAPDGPVSTYDIVALVDGSGSMAEGDKLSSVKAAAKWIVETPWRRPPSGSWMTFLSRLAQCAIITSMDISTGC